jgi:hypothetical protein
MTIVNGIRRECLSRSSIKDLSIQQNKAFQAMIDGGAV